MLDREFQRNILQGYLVAILLVLTVVTYFVLAGAGFPESNEFVVMTTLLIVLISVNTVQAIIFLRTLDYLDQ